MSMTSPTTTDLSAAIDSLSVASIDREVAALTDALSHRVSDMEVAVTLEGRRQALVEARRLAVVRERVQLRQLQRDEALEARDAFAQLELDVPPRLRAEAAAIDAWITEGARLLNEYRTTTRRLAEVHGTLGPPPLRRELHLYGLFKQIENLGEWLEQALTGAGVLPGALSPLARESSATLERVVERRVTRFLDEARQRLPPAPAPDDGVTESGI